MLAPANTAPQTPNFVASAGGNTPQPQPQASQGKPEKPVTHGLVSGQDIDDRLSTMPRSAQQMFLQACATIKTLPDIFGTAIGPEAHDYIAAVQQALAQQQNSTQGASAPAGQNPPAAPQGPSGGTPAMATSAAPAPSQGAPGQ